MASAKAGDKDDHVSLGMYEFYQFCAKVAHLFNPLWWFDLWFTPVTG